MAAGKLCPQNRCPLFTHKGMQISPSAEWTLRTDPHGTHTLSQMCMECCTAMKLPSIKRKTSRTNDKAHPHSCCVCCVRACACVRESEHVRSPKVIFCYDNKKSAKSLETAIHKHVHANIQSKHFISKPHLRAKYGVWSTYWWPHRCFCVCFFKYLSCSSPWQHYDGR